MYDSLCVACFRGGNALQARLDLQRETGPSEKAELKGGRLLLLEYVLKVLGIQHGRQ